MSKHKIYLATDKMSDLITENFEMLQVLSRFGLSLGFGDQTVEEVCRQSNVEYQTFLIVVNFLTGDPDNWKQEMGKGLSIPALVDYLKQSHSYYLDFELPSIRKKLIEAIDFTGEEEVSFLIIQFFDAYVGEVRKHLEYENKKVFAYVNALLEGKQANDYNINVFARHHDQTNAKLAELKNIIIKYYPPAKGDNELMNATLFDIFNCEKDLAAHKQVEDLLFVPAIRELEKEISRKSFVPKKESIEEENTESTLSQREKEILECIVRGMSNKEIADKLFISVHTAMTHRRNITRKLQIHSAAGLTIYAIVNKLVELKDINTNI